MAKPFSTEEERRQQEGACEGDQGHAPWVVASPVVHVLEAAVAGVPGVPGGVVLAAAEVTSEDGYIELAVLADEGRLSSAGACIVKGVDIGGQWVVPSGIQ